MTIFDLSSSAYTETQKQVIVWFILRELLNHFLGQPHSDDLRCLLIVDECHRFYGEGVPRSAAVVLENAVKQGRSKGLGVVMLTQTLRDLPEVLTQANIRILLRILEGEIQAYGAKFGMELARTLHTLEPRHAYVFDSGEQLYCHFRPTLSLPQGVSDHQTLRGYSRPSTVLRTFSASVMSKENKTQPSRPSVTIESESGGLTDDERLVIEKLRELGGSVRSKRLLQIQLGFGRQKIVDLVKKLEQEGRLKTRTVQNRVALDLPDKSS
jgi:hypothetical protein